MGIRFRCHHCEHELNLKNFQAGRRARCPLCSGRFRVPTTSCDFSTPLEDDEQELASTALRADQPGAGRSEAAPSFDLQQPTGDLERFKRQAPEPIVTPAAGKLPQSSKKLGSKKRAAKQAPTRPAATPQSAPTPLATATQTAASEATAVQATAVQATAVQTTAVQATAVQAAAVPSASPEGTATQAAAPQLPLSSGDPQGGAVTATAATAAASPGIPPAIAAAPQAVWYVRPPSGGQFGPADSATFYQWMQENRVAREALVWRDGWPQWMVAAEAFEEYYGPKWLVPEASSEALSATPAPAPAPAPAAAEPADAQLGIAAASGVVVSAVEPALGLSPLAAPGALASAPPGLPSVVAAAESVTPTAVPLRPPSRRKRRRTNYALGIGFLAILAIALVVILIVVLMSQ